MPATVDITYNSPEYRKGRFHGNGSFKSDAEVFPCKKELLLVGNPNQTYLKTNHQGLLGLFCEAAKQGFSVTLRPDDIWIAVTTCIGAYINNHAEELRYLFVDWEGRRQIIVTIGEGSVYQIGNTTLGSMTQSFKDGIKKNLKQEVVDLFLPKMTTSTTCDLISNCVSTMGAFEKYFEYIGAQGSQGPSSTYTDHYGLTQINFEGKLEDWQTLRQNAQELANFLGNTPDEMTSKQKMHHQNFQKWSAHLTQAIDYILESFQGTINNEVWEKMFTYTRTESSAYVSGWALAFAPFDASGTLKLNQQLRDTDLYKCQANAPIKLLFHNRDNNCSVQVKSGIMGYTFKNGSLAPVSNWIFCDPEFMEDPLFKQTNQVEPHWEQQRPLESPTPTKSQTTQFTQSLEGPQGVSCPN